MYKILFEQLSKNFTKIVFYAAVLFGFYFLYKNYNAVVDWIKNKFTSIRKNETPTQSDLKDSTYILDDKIIKNYVDLLYQSIDKYGTDHVTINNVYQNLRFVAPYNTVKVWNEYNSRNLKYDKGLGVYGYLNIGEKYNLYQVLKEELQHDQNEKNTLINWTNLLKRAGLI